MRFHPFVSAALIGPLLTSAPALAQGVAPRYKLAAGQEIQYEAVSDSKGPDSASHDQITRTLWVIRHNEDGSSRVVERDATKSSETPRNGTAATSESENVSCFDVFADGRVVPDETMAAARPSLFVFPRLPQGATDNRWRSDYSDGGHADFDAVPEQTTATDLVFGYQEHSLVHDIYLEANDGIVHFDPARGLLITETSQSSMDYGFHVKTTTSSRLKSVETRDPAFMERLARESQIYFKATDDYEHAEGIANRNAAGAEAIMKRAGDALRAARSELTLPMFSTGLDKMLSRHDHIVSYFKQEAQHDASLIGKSAANFSLKDLDGQSHALSDYRGKVVVLDFWYRACGWCLKAMPVVEKVAGDLQADSVVVLGMNTDRDEKDARFVADKMHLNYTTLLAGAFPERYEKYGVRAFPTFIVIDSQGVVRQVLSGYSPDLRQELDREVRSLLPRGTPQ